MNLICENCHSEFVRDRKRRFCCLACAYEFSKGKPQDPEFVAKRAAAMKGKKRGSLSKNHRLNISKSLKGIKRHFTEEHKHNIKVAARKRQVTIHNGDYHYRIKNWPPKIWTEVDMKPLLWIVCPCGQKFLQNDYRQKYCSFECSCRYKRPFTKEHKKNLSINSQKRSEAAKIIFVCSSCGTEIVMMRSKAKKRKYCDECAIKINVENCIARAKSDDLIKFNSERMKGRNNPVFTHPESFKYKGCRYYDDLGLRLRSGWEANMARIIQAMGYEFEYEPKAFNLSNGTTYTPDFYIPELDEWVEVKGRWIGDAKIKVKRFMFEYPNINLNIIGPIEYKGLIEEYDYAVS